MILTRKPLLRKEVHDEKIKWKSLVVFLLLLSGGSTTCIQNVLADGVSSDSFLSEPQELRKSAENLVWEKIRELTGNRMDSHGRACGKNLVNVDGKEQTLFLEGNVTIRDQSESWVLWEKSNPSTHGYESKVKTYLETVLSSGPNRITIYAKLIEIIIDGGFVYIHSEKKFVQCKLTGRLFDHGIRIKKWLFFKPIISPEEALELGIGEFINIERSNPSAVLDVNCLSIN
ncbi:MAG: hypothetical protein K1X29_04405 [Bdellovibrionales bacterium]|nr:hypothetical protein [Bdellovibrionales bacterium]